MQLVEVAVPKNSKVISRGGACIALQLGRREEKVPARLFGPNLGRYKGNRIVCTVAVTSDRNQSGDVIPVVVLKPVKSKRARPTHGTPFWDGTNIVIPSLSAAEARLN